MKKYLPLLLLLILACGCSVVNKQHYYVPDGPHTATTESHVHSKMIRQSFPLSDGAGEMIGSLTTSNGAGRVLLAGPPYLPVLPAGLISIFVKSETRFTMDLDIKCNDSYLMSLAIDSNSFKSTRDSLAAGHLSTAVLLKTNACYMIVNGAKRVPLKVKEYFMGALGHHYRLIADINFASVHTAQIFTGNPALDRNLVHIVFAHQARLTYLMFGLS